MKDTKEIKCFPGWHTYKYNLSQALYLKITQCWLIYKNIHISEYSLLWMLSGLGAAGWLLVGYLFFWGYFFCIITVAIQIWVF